MHLHNGALKLELLHPSKNRDISPYPHTPLINYLQLFVHNFVHGDLHPGNILVQQPTVNQPKLVLLDCGIATALQPLDLENMHCVFTAVVTGQGWKVADLFLAGQTCATLDEYRREMASVVDAAVSDLNLQKVRSAHRQHYSHSSLAAGEEST